MVGSKMKCTSWAIVATMERPDKTWYTETITDIDDDTASTVDSFLTEYCDEKKDVEIIKEDENFTYTQLELPFPKNL